MINSAEISPFKSSHSKKKLEISTPHVLSSMPANVDIKEDEVDTDLQGTPEWLTKDYFENCLRTHYNDKHLEVCSMKAHPASGKGENYGRILTRVRVDFRPGQGQIQKGNYVVKTFHEADEFSRKMMEPYDIFNREMAIYEKVLPNLNDLLAETGDNEQIFAKTISVDYARSALVFEDLNVRNFTTPSRLDGLDIKHAKIVLRKLAKIHATSAVMNARENGFLESFDRGMFNRHTENCRPAFVGLFQAGTEMVSKWQGFEVITKKLQALTPLYIEMGKRVFDSVDGHVNVLAHGNLWTKNVMVQYAEASDEPLDAIIIDYQYAAWGSPAIDLYYLLNTSLKEELHVHGQDELIKYYYTVFEDILRKLKYKAHIPSLHQFHLQLEEKEFYALSSTFSVLPIHRNEFTEEADFPTSMKEDERSKRACFENAYCQRIIRRLLPKFEQRGLLDINQ